MGRAARGRASGNGIVTRSDPIDVALFPLHTVLYPGGPLSLRIFEPRYLDMVSECLREERPFAVCLIESGEEAGAPATHHEIGTFARIVDWRRNDDGLLGLSAIGEQRCRVLDSRVAANKLVRGSVRAMPAEPSAPLPADCRYMSDLLRELLERAGPLYASLPSRYDDASWVGFRLAEILALPLARKQYFLEIEDPILRLRQLDEILRAMSESTA